MTPKRRRRNRENKQAVAYVAIFVLVVGLWTQGAFDNVLYKVGLNWDECLTNYAGATFCGVMAREYKQRTGQ